ncbi:MAG TPA: type II secretion system F family protein, partial [Verrucomicrobiae bacterium]|nr:type II secretion system F family protein [Verrucomicrobiae bacterium]
PQLVAMLAVGEQIGDTRRVLPACRKALATIVYSLLILPLRNQERARVFLDLVETGFAEGHSAETTIIEFAKLRDKKLGRRFFLLATHLDAGLRLSQALEKVPGLLPPQLVAMLAVGEQIGDTRRVLPACRKALAIVSSKTASTVNYLILFLALNPCGGLIWPFIAIIILPKFREIAIEFGSGHLPPLFQFLCAHALLLAVLQWSLIGMSCLLLTARDLSPKMTRWLTRLLKPTIDAINYRLPWRRKRLERDFTAMLALLLDAEVPEEQAVTLAAQSTDNVVFMRRGAQVAKRLRDGVIFLEAIRGIDDTGELHWRLTNAVHGHGGFMKALAGWHEALEARAYQLEQAASQTITTSLVVLNGCLVGLIAIGVFQVLISIVWDVSLW